MEEEIKLNITGKPPMGFVGEEIFRADFLKDKFRKKQIRVFTRKLGGFIVGVGTLTIMEGEHQHYSVTKIKTREKVLAFVMNTFPEADLMKLTDILYPPKKEEHGERRSPEGHKGDEPEQHQESSTKILS